MQGRIPLIKEEIKPDRSAMEMESSSGVPATSPQLNTIKFYYSKRYESDSRTENKRSAAGRQSLPPSSLGHATPCIRGLKLGAFYEIDHGKLPPKSPIQLKAIRIVKVSETRELDVTVSFPSTLSLRNYFALSPVAGRDPELDEKFVMSANQAGRILRRLIPSSEMDDRKHLESFWLVTPILREFPPIVLPSSSGAKKAEEPTQQPPAGSCLVALEGSGLVRWGIRRKIKYVGRHVREPSESEMMEKEDETSEVNEQMIGEDDNSESLRKLQKDDKEDETSTGKGVESSSTQADASEQKRKRHATYAKMQGPKERRNKRKKSTDKKSVVSKQKKKKGRPSKDDKASHETDNHEIRGSKDRWSTERYEAAEKKLLDIMKEKDATLGKPIMRQALRDEARNYIGDTGLLDHLLKHMSGKVVSDGTQRFRRRHNSEGVMEYWLEPVELEEIRKKAGVQDPYWAPPPGWKPGESTSICGVDECKNELITQLKEEMSLLWRNLEQLMLKNVSKGHVAEEDKSESVTGCSITCKDFQENYHILIQKSNKLEEELANMKEHTKRMEEELRVLREENCAKRKVAETQVMTEKEGMQLERRDDENTKRKDTADTVCNTTAISPIIKNSSGTRNDDQSTNATPTADANAATTQTRTPNNKKNSDSSSASNSKKAAIRKSGFTICKPQGTFLWPNMGNSGTFACISNLSSPMSAATAAASASAGATLCGEEMLASLSPSSSRRSLLDASVVPSPLLMVPSTSATTNIIKSACTALEEHLTLYNSGIPTPSSTASSATSAPRLLILPTPPSPALTRTPQPSEMLLVPSPNCSGPHQLQAEQHHLLPRTTSLSSCGDGGLGTGSGGELGWNKGASDACVGSWESASQLGGRDVAVTTDLALATPSISPSYN